MHESKKFLRRAIAGRGEAGRQGTPFLETEERGEENKQLSKVGERAWGGKFRSLPYSGYQEQPNILLAHKRSEHPSIRVEGMQEGGHSPPDGQRSKERENDKLRGRAQGQPKGTKRKEVKKPNPAMGPREEEKKSAHSLNRQAVFLGAARKPQGLDVKTHHQKKREREFSGKYLPLAKKPNPIQPWA